MNFLKRHIGSSDQDILEILKTLKVSSLEELTNQILPEEVNKKESFSLEKALSEYELLKEIKKIAKKNKLFKSYIGRGYKNSITPPPIQRHILENPSWYSSYTPYQSELAQGRLEALLNFQTMIADLTGMEIANASLLDEGTALAEALTFCKNANSQKQQAKKVFIDSRIFPQSLEVIKTRRSSWKGEIVTGEFENFKGGEDFFAVILQYPFADGSLIDIETFIQEMKQKKIFVITAVDLLSLCLLKAPGEMGADVAVGSSQNFGIPLFFGGPHAGFFATKKEFIRLIPGRIVGVSKDRHGKQAYRLSLQTREQHIRREKATSNICTAQSLLAVMASFYAIYHGPKNLKKIALNIHELTKKLYHILKSFPELEVLNSRFFDTLSFKISSPQKAKKLKQNFLSEKINIFYKNSTTFSITLDETCLLKDLTQIEKVLKSVLSQKDLESKNHLEDLGIAPPLLRTSEYLTHPVFNSYHSETELTRYIHRLQKKELSLTHSMIPLGSCTMKLNAVTQLLPVSWPEFSDIHPFVPSNQTKGYQQIMEELEKQLCEITGFSAFSFQPNAGSQGEYAGLLAIKKYHESKNEKQRNICLIPVSAHGTNPASAIMAGFEVKALSCTKEGRIDIKDLKNKLEQYGDKLAGLMMTYPSTYGFFEEVKDICHKVHQKGALIYLDGANMNALLGLCKASHLGFDVCHLNLHKSFCIPHGGGGPGVGPVGVNEKLKNFLPGHFYLDQKTNLGAISSAPYGSAGILMISWAYIKLMGLEGLKKSAQVAMANANYIAEKLEEHYRILYKGSKNRVAHECIIDLRKFKNTAGITIDDIAKRLMDYSFHSPTMSWPVPGTLMIEPTESENKKELDRFCSALISIRKEIKAIEEGKTKASLLKSAPHNLEDLMKEDWNFPYSKKQAFYPLDWIQERKFWTPVSRIENTYGDINPFCSCPPVS
ncbi:MAG: aminomethyl-transferring glycine dehydrogenase [Bdellovibrionales bacterium]|nr:aminomethyl-transferring glycine dehydrogenase [Bdellovibrionales bacterium]